MGVGDRVERFQWFFRLLHDHVHRADMRHVVVFFLGSVLQFLALIAMSAEGD